MCVSLLSTTTDPFYPLFSAGVAALVSIGHTVPFPPRSAFGPHCGKAISAINRWGVEADAWQKTFEIAYLSVLPLLAGVIAVLRTIGRGRRRWEPAAVVTVALLPPVWMCVESTFHPEDLFAMGFALLAIACARRSAWVWAGFWIGLALVAQPFAVLVATPLVVLAPARNRLRFVGSALVSLAVILLPLAVVGSQQVKGGLLHQLQTGIQNGSTSVVVSGTVVWELHLSGTGLLVVSRAMPIAFSFLLACWVRGRLGERSLEPVVLLSLIAVCLGLRLVFEETLFGYYFMALAVALVLVDVARGRVRATTVAWITVVSFVFGVMSQPVHVFNDSWADTAQNVRRVRDHRHRAVAPGPKRPSTKDLRCPGLGRRSCGHTRGLGHQRKPVRLRPARLVLADRAGLVRPGPGGDTVGARGRGAPGRLRTRVPDPRSTWSVRVARWTDTRGSVLFPAALRVRPGFQTAVRQSCSGPSAPHAPGNRGVHDGRGAPGRSARL